MPWDEGRSIIRTCPPLPPGHAQVRHSKREVGEQLEALYNQYDAEDFDLGIKQFMIEQAIQQVCVGGGVQDAR